jgi:hypothetical protein
MEETSRGRQPPLKIERVFARSRLEPQILADPAHGNLFRFQYLICICQVRANHVPLDFLLCVLEVRITRAIPALQRRIR